MPSLLRSWFPLNHLRLERAKHYLFSDTSGLCLPCVRKHSLGQRYFTVPHRPSGTVSLAKLGHQTHSRLSNHLGNLTSSSYPVSDTLSLICVFVCVWNSGLRGCVHQPELSCLSLVNDKPSVCFLYLSPPPYPPCCCSCRVCFVLFGCVPIPASHSKSKTGWR